jgi:hypothetical protein
LAARCLVFALVCSALTVPAWAGHTLTAQEQKVLQSWLAYHAEYRAATDEDCDCADDIQQMKAGFGGVWKPVSDYHPYAATGDFNGDGVEDFAVAVVDRSKQEKNFALVVFNGPFKLESASPAFLEAGLELRSYGLFYGPPRPKPYRLLVGRFESDSGSLLIPQGHGYRLGDSGGLRAARLRLTPRAGSIGAERCLRHRDGV